MAEIIRILRPRQFTEEEAETLLPAVKRITAQAALEAEKITEQLRFIPRDEPIFNRLSSELDLVIRRWAIKVSKLGLKPSGIWIVDFDAGEGLYTWRLGDEHVSYFSARTARSEENPLEQSSPDKSN
jgi:hypothetical protein